MTTAAEILRAARDTLSDPKHWTQEIYARDANGVGVPWGSETAVCWCAYGALYRFEYVKGSAAEEHLRQAADDLFRSFPAAVNDEQGHADVLRMYDRAIELAEAQS